MTSLSKSVEQDTMTKLVSEAESKAKQGFGGIGFSQSDSKVNTNINNESLSYTNTKLNNLIKNAVTNKSKTKNYSGDNAADHTFSDHETALAFCENEYIEKEIFIIGGSAIYQLYMPLIDRFFITEINSIFPCDTFFNLSYVQTNFFQHYLLFQYNTC